MDELFPGHGVIYQLGHGVLALFDLRGLIRGFSSQLRKSRPPMAVLVLSSTHRRLPRFSPARMVSVSSKFRRAVRSSSRNRLDWENFQRPHVGKLRLLIFL